MSIAKDEVLGQVVAVSVFDTEAEAIARANGSIYGLAASVWSDDLNRAHRVARAQSRYRLREYHGCVGRYRSVWRW